jgi:hypothetical protein
MSYLSGAIRTIILNDDDLKLKRTFLINANLFLDISDRRKMVIGRFYLSLKIGSIIE